jgi:hypothetical protein
MSTMTVCQLSPGEDHCGQGISACQCDVTPACLLPANGCDLACLNLPLPPAAAVLAPSLASLPFLAALAAQHQKSLRQVVKVSTQPACRARPLLPSHLGAPCQGLSRTVCLMCLQSGLLHLLGACVLPAAATSGWSASAT